MTSNAPDTFPKLLLEHAWPDRTTRKPRKRLRNLAELDLGASRRRGRGAARGLSAMGFIRGDKLAIIGDNRPRLYWAIAATQALGGCRSRSIRTRSPRRWPSSSITPRCVSRFAEDQNRSTSW